MPITLPWLLENKLGIVDAEEIARKIPMIDIGDQMGSTGYLDFFRLNDFPYPVVWGYDTYQRLFLAMKTNLTWSIQDGPYIPTEPVSPPEGGRSVTKRIDNKPKKKKILVVFKRYILDHDQIWVNCGPLPDRLMRPEYWTIARQCFLTCYAELTKPGLRRIRSFNDCVIVHGG